MTTAPHVLSFALTITEDTQLETFGEKTVSRPYLAVEPRPLINGLPMLEQSNDYVFDAGSIICRGLEAWSFNPFTCGCGTPECAGIWDKSHLEVYSDVVRWVLPEEPYRTKLNAQLRKEGEVLALEFAVEQYTQALTDLEQQLLQLEAESSVPVVLLPDSYPNLNDKLGPMFEKGKVHLRSWIESERHRIAIYGSLLDKEIYVELPGGTRYTIQVSSLVFAVAHIIEEQTGTPWQDAVEQTVLPLFHSSDERILAAARDLDSESARISAWQEHDEHSEEISESDAEVDVDWQKEWPNAKLTLRNN